MEIAVRLLNPLLMIAMPLALAVYLVRRFGVAWRLFAIGATTFFASQLLHIPFNILALNPLFKQIQSSEIPSNFALIAIAVILGLSAGVFEECSRYLIFRFWLKKERSWDQMVVFGLGHGGFEAILLGVWTLYLFFQAFALWGPDLAPIIPADQLQSVTTSLTFYWDAPWYLALLGALERAFAICLHLGLTGLVWQAVVRRSIGWVGLAVAWHALANAGALIINQIWGPYLAEGFIGLVAAISLLSLIALRRRGPVEKSAAAIARPQPRLDTGRGIAAENVSQRKLDESRYLD